MRLPRAKACYLQCGAADDRFSYRRGDRPVLDGSDRMDELLPMLDAIRSHGLPAGIGTHFWVILEEMQRRGYDPDFFVTTLNYVGVHCRGYAETVRLINTIAKPFVVIKTLGGSAKVRPQDGFTCAYTAIKPTDIVAVGIEHEEAVREDAALAAGIIGCLKR